MSSQLHQESSSVNSAPHHDEQTAFCPGDRVQLVLSVDNMNTSVSGRESLNSAAEPGRDLLEIDVFDDTKSVRAKNRCNASRLETAVGVNVAYR
jgi:hypothetical protein